SVGVFVVAILILKVISAVLKWYAETIATKTDTTLDDEFIPLLDRTVKIVIITLAVLIVLDQFGVDVKGLVAVLGVGSLAIALAAKDTLANMIGGFTIMIDRPFRVGDMVRLADGNRVVVHEIGIRSSKFLTFDNTLVIVPNSEIIKSTVHNITYPHPRVRVVVKVGVSYDSDLKKVREVMLDEAAKNSKILTDPRPQVLFRDFGDSALAISLRCYIGRAKDHRRAS
ncbi:MAG: mechanosensitive ion channel family protein, partial [FCB group bacterium]|nr:mechanosensitive ion channel family protein [FCB group bacterium]